MSTSIERHQDPGGLVAPRWTSAGFLARVEAGSFGDDRRVDLWDGRVRGKMAKTIPHALTSRRVEEVLRARLPDGWLILREDPVVLGEGFIPLPDLALIRGPLATYEREARHPTSADLGLIVEVSVSSLARDPGPRAEGFARFSVPLHWVVDVAGRRVAEHRDPRPHPEPGRSRYESVRIFRPGESIRLDLGGRDVDPIPVGDLLP